MRNEKRETKNKKLKKSKIKKFNNQVINNFKIIIIIKKIDNVKHEKYTIKNKTYKSWKAIWNCILFWV